MSRRTIHITHEHITRCIPADSSHCMIADAIKEQVPGALRVSVDLATIRFSIGDKRYIHLTPPIAQRSLLWFDQGDARLTPFKFSLNRPAQVTAVGRTSRKPKGKIKGKTVVHHHGDHAPIIKGGRTIPSGSLIGGDLRGTVKADAIRTGRIRRYGLKGMGH